MSDSDHNEEYTTKLEALRLEHRDLDEVIRKLADDPNVDDLQLRRMKKRKLHLKDQIFILENQLISDTSA